MRAKAWAGRNDEASVGFSPSSPNGRRTEVYAAMSASNEPLPESLVGRYIGAVRMCLARRALAAWARCIARATRS